VWLKSHSDRGGFAHLLLRLFPLEQFGEAAIENTPLPIVMMIFRAIDYAVAAQINRRS
jgi:hypothetical protein